MFSQRICTCITRIIVNQQRRNMSKMLEAVLKYKDGNRFSFSFLYQNQDLNIRRELNFNRSTTETVGHFCKRIISSVDKVLGKKKKKNLHTKLNEAAAPRVNLVKNNVPVAEETCCFDVLFESGIVLQVGENEYTLDINPPSVKLMVLPNIIMANFPVYPYKLELEFANKEQSFYHWYRSTQVEGEVSDEDKEEKKIRLEKTKNNNWELVGSNFFYTPSIADIGCKLQLVCTPVQDDKVGSPSECTSIAKVDAGPGPCPFEDRHAVTKDLTGDLSFRLVSYNILADLYADSDYSRTTLFPYCPHYALEIHYRKQLILKELIGYNSDIICLQEVDKKVFEGDLLPVLSSVGFQSIFDAKGGNVSEGMACFFRKSKFSLVEADSNILSQELPNNPLFKELWEKIKLNEKLVEKLAPRTQVLQTIVLDSAVKPDQRLIIGITHLYFRPDADHIRLLHATMCLMYLEQKCQQYSAETKDKNISVILCGDFNSTPKFGVYKLMTTQHIPEDYPDWTVNEEEAVKGVSVNSPFLMGSACGTPEYTNYTVRFADCLDYIFYQMDKLKVQRVIPFPSKDELQQYTALPSVVFPSDHIALVADLAWKE